MTVLARRKPWRGRLSRRVAGAGGPKLADLAPAARFSPPRSFAAGETVTSVPEITGAAGGWDAAIDTGSVDAVYDSALDAVVLRNDSGVYFESRPSGVEEENFTIAVLAMVGAGKSGKLIGGTSATDRYLIDLSSGWYGWLNTQAIPRTSRPLPDPNDWVLHALQKDGATGYYRYKGTTYQDSASSALRFRGTTLFADWDGNFEFSAGGASIAEWLYWPLAESPTFEEIEAAARNEYPLFSVT